ncbi:MAG: hypothetical protein L0Y56_08010, partial [Nitrospira sp.]|nr:hypothetical protein [Nitrospira sp.]
FPNFFGSEGHCNWGHVNTKLLSIQTASQMAERELTSLSQKEINSILGYTDLQIVFSLCTDDSRRQDHKIVLKQGEKVIQASKVTLGIPETTSAWPNYPPYSVRLSAYFAYGSFDPVAPTTIVVVPYVGKRLFYEVKFSEFK